MQILFERKLFRKATTALIIFVTYFENQKQLYADQDIT